MRCTQVHCVQCMHCILCLQCLQLCNEYNVNILYNVHIVSNAVHARYQILTLYTLYTLHAMHTMLCTLFTMYTTCSWKPLVYQFWGFGGKGRDLLLSFGGIAGSAAMYSPGSDKILFTLVWRFIGLLRCLVTLVSFSLVFSNELVFESFSCADIKGNNYHNLILRPFS